MNTDLTDEEKAKQSDARWREETDDFHNAIAGRDTGRQMRFGGTSKEDEAVAREKAERVFRDALDLLLQDPEYRALYGQLGQSLSEAERLADRVMVDIQNALRALDQDIADMEARAAKTLDGSPVFRTADGRVVGADGDALPPEIADGIIWPPNAPSAEDYFDAQTRRSDLATGLDDWSAYRGDTLGGLRDRYEDRDNPMRKVDLEGALEEIDSARPAEIAREASAPSAEAQISPGPAAFPTIGG